MNKRWIGIVSGWLVLALAVWGFLNWRNLYDSYLLASYSPPAEIAAIAKQTGLSDTGKRYFYVAEPTVDDRETFNRLCPQLEKGINVLGCYNSQGLGRPKISLFDIQNEELTDEVYVIAAHEMLHSAYDRLNFWERDEVDKLLQQAVKNIPQNELTEVIQNYLKDGNWNELHSHLGTEYANLPPELEQYYARYLTNRNQLVAIHKGNEALFEQCEDRNDSLVSQIQNYKQQIESTRQQLESTRAQMDANLAQNNISAYNSLVPRHNSLVARHNNLVEIHNQKVNQLNSQVDYCNNLVKSFNSGLQPIETEESI